MCDEGSENKFRNYSDVSQYLAQAWQLCSGKFYPRKTVGKSFLLSQNNYKTVIKYIKGKKFNIICLNDSIELSNYNEIIFEIETAINSIYPNKSSYEL